MCNLGRRNGQCGGSRPARLGIHCLRQCRGSARSICGVSTVDCGQAVESGGVKAGLQRGFTGRNRCCSEGRSTVLERHCTSGAGAGNRSSERGNLADRGRVCARRQGGC